MAESTRATTSSEEGRPLERALRAQIDAGQLALLAAYRAFIAHTETCRPCREANVDCDEAASLRRAYRVAKAATP